MGLIEKLARAEEGVDRLGKSLARLPDVGPVGGGASGGGGPRGASALDLKRVELQIDGVSRKLDKMGSRQGDPFLDDLMRGKGPRKA